MEREFVHFTLPLRVESMSGFYELIEEKVTEINGKKLLYYRGYGAADNSCCGYFGCGYVLVIGYLEKYKALKNDEGLDISFISPIEGAQSSEIEKILKESEHVSQVMFFDDLH